MFLLQGIFGDRQINQIKAMHHPAFRTTYLRKQLVEILRQPFRDVRYDVDKMNLISQPPFEKVHTEKTMVAAAVPDVMEMFDDHVINTLKAPAQFHDCSSFLICSYSSHNNRDDRSLHPISPE